MTFTEAFKLLLTGQRVSRGEWMGNISFWEYCATSKHIRQVYPDGSAECFDSIYVDDILADDWFKVT